MGFLSFLRDMIVFDWLFGHHEKKSFGSHDQRMNNSYTDYMHDYDSGCTNYGGYDNDDFVQRDFDDDLDSGMFDDF